MRGPTSHVAAVLLAAVLWGTTGTVAHNAPPGSDQTLVGVATFGFGALALVLIDARPVVRLLRDAGRADWLRLLAGAAGVIAYASLYYASMALVGVAVGNVLALGSGPVFAGLYEVLLDGRRVRVGWVVATVVAVAGIALLAAGQAAAVGPAAVWGIACGLGAGAGYALYSYAAAGLIARGRASRPVLATIFGLSALPLLPWFFLAGPGPLLTWRGASIIAYLALLPMALAYLLFGYGLRGLAASTATTLALAEPLVATLLATVLLHERLGPLGWAGLVLVACGLVLVAWDEARSAARAGRRVERVRNEGNPA